MKRILTIALLLLLAAPASAGGRFPETIELPDGWQPEGIATGRDNSFYSGSRATGAIWKGDLRTGQGDVLVDPLVGGGAALGMKVDYRNRLFVAGGGTGTASVYDAGSGELLRRYALTTAPTFVNDVIVTEQAAYFTDSLKRQLYVLDLGRRGELPVAARTLPLTGDIQLEPVGGFELNGIEAAGRRLIAVHSAQGKLFAIHPVDGDTEAVEVEGGDGLGGSDFANGDGLLLDGRTLYVVQNRLNRIAVVRLDDDLEEGRITGYLTDSDFDVPTTIAEAGGFLWAVNARFTTEPTPDTEYHVVKVRR
jgi:sugar lactone lactonase YvrE